MTRSESSWILPLSSISITDRETRFVLDALDRGEVSGTGSDVIRVEAMLEEFLGAGSAIATSSGTSALELAIACLEPKPGQEIIVPAFTFAAPAAAVLNSNLVPVMCDVKDDTWTLDVDACSKLISERTAAVIAVDIMGNPCEYDRLRSLGVPVIEDAAEGLGGTFDGQPVGGLGDIGILSFHANKTVSSGEGGAMIASDPRLARRGRLLAHHGMTAGYVHVVAGRNLRMQNLTAAFLAAQISRLDELVGGRRLIADAYRSRLAALPLTWQAPAPGADPAVWLTAVRTPQRNELVAHLRRAGIDARAVWPALADQPFLREFSAECPVARTLAAEVLWLPTYADLDMYEVDWITQVVYDFFRPARVG